MRQQQVSEIKQNKISIFTDCIFRNSILEFCFISCLFIPSFSLLFLFFLWIILIFDFFFICLHLSPCHYFLIFSNLYFFSFSTFFLFFTCFSISLFIYCFFLIVIFFIFLPDSMTWVFDKKILNNSGFSIDPDKVEKLPSLTR